MKTLKELLIELKACKEAIEWAQDRTIEQAVTECERTDWILWLAEKVGCDKRKLVLCGGLCVNTVRHLMTDERSMKAVDTAIYYGIGNATEQELDAACDAAWGAARASAWGAAMATVRASAWDAACDAAWGAARASAWGAACDAAMATARASAWGAECDAAWGAALKGMSEIVRPIIADELIQKVNNLL